jgi:hypothetical protein
VALLVARWAGRKRARGIHCKRSILLIPHVIIDVLPTTTGDLRLPESLMGSTPQMVGDRDMIRVSVDLKAHRGFARNWIAGIGIRGDPPSKY